MSLRAAIFARKSTEQHVSDDAKSVTRQIELGREFAASKGWTVVGEYADDGVSGRLRTKLVNRNRMLAAAMAEEFDVLIVRDLDRLSRNDEELPGLVYTLRDAGVEVWCYADGQRVDTKTAMQRGMLSMKATFGAAETEGASTRTREQKRNRYAKTPNADGRVYGYRNVGEPKQRRREIEPVQAEIVRRIFEMTASGLGLFRIAKTLNEEGVPSPAGDGWATTGVREMLRRDLYRGVSVYGKTTWEWRDGGKFKTAVPEAQWLRVEAPHLRIVNEELWRAAHARLDRTRQTYPGRRLPYGQLLGRLEAGLESRHLLSGFLRCGSCGGNMFVAPVSGRRSQPTLFYRCTTHHKRGNTRCSNRWGLPYQKITRQVLSHFSDLTMEKTLELVRAEEARRVKEFEAQHGTRAATEAEIERLGTELGRLARAVAAGGEIEELVTLMQQTQKRRDALLVKLTDFSAGQSPDELEKCVIAVWKEFSAAFEWPPSGPRARQALRLILREPITVTPVVTNGYLREWEYLGMGLLDRALAGRMRPSVTNAYATELVPPG